MARVKVMNPTDTAHTLRAMDGASTTLNPGFIGMIDEKFLWQFPDKTLRVLAGEKTPVFSTTKAAPAPLPRRVEEPKKTDE